MVSLSNIWVICISNIENAVEIVTLNIQFVFHYVMIGQYY